MADINKSALLILNDDRTKFLVTRKKPGSVTTEWIMPGGGIENGETDKEAVAREIREELSCETDMETLEFVGEYEAPAAGQEHKTVNIKLYRGSVSGDPVASSEIDALGWLGKDDRENMDASLMIRKYIIPDITAKGILK